MWSSSPDEDAVSAAVLDCGVKLQFGARGPAGHERALYSCGTVRVSGGDATNLHTQQVRGDSAQRTGTTGILNSSFVTGVRGLNTYHTLT